jgi:hypothetical protein
MRWFLCNRTYLLIFASRNLSPKAPNSRCLFSTATENYQRLSVSTRPTVVPGVIVSEPYYEHNAEPPIRKLDSHDVYHRRVDWLTDDADEVQSIPTQALPQPYQQPPSGTGAKCTRDLDDQLLLADALSAGQHLAEAGW